jgi:hypothetical protein
MSGHRRGRAPLEGGPLERDGNGWRVRFEALSGAAPSSSVLREVAATQGVADDLLLAAALSGAVSNHALLEILDGGGFERAACLCCYRAPDAAARAMDAALRRWQGYYSATAYVASRAFARAVAALSRDLLPDELAEVRAHIAHLDATPELVREINRLGAVWGVCVAAPRCRPNTLWVYSTQAGRRLLRSLARSLGGQGHRVRVAVASSDPAVLPRFRYRMYAASVGSGDAAPLLEAAAAWVRERAPDKLKKPKHHRISGDAVLSHNSGVRAGVPAAVLRRHAN